MSALKKLFTASYRLLVLVVFIFCRYTFTAADAAMDAVDAQEKYYKYTTVTGYFLQDDPRTDPATFDFATTSLGLVDRTYDTDASLPGEGLTQWQRFAVKLKSLNLAAPSGTRYILAYVARHGEGWHNRAVEKYGTRAWDCHWSTLEGDEEMSWADAKLTDVGVDQAVAVNTFWQREIDQQSILTPEKFFVSPLDRCLRTAQLTWTGIKLATTGYGFEPEVKEMLRECIGIHTCDRRSSKSYIQSTYPYHIEPGFAEEDPLWIPDLRESDSALTMRLKHCLDEILRHHDETTVFSLTSHGGAVQALLRAIGHRRFSLPTGSVIPLLIKAELLHGPEPEMPVEPWEPKPSC